MFGSQTWNHFTAVEGKWGHGGPSVAFIVVEMQSTLTQAAPLLPPHLIHQQRQVACKNGTVISFHAHSHFVFSFFFSFRTFSMRIYFLGNVWLGWLRWEMNTEHSTTILVVHGIVTHNLRPDWQLGPSQHGLLVVKVWLIFNTRHS